MTFFAISRKTIAAALLALAAVLFSSTARALDVVYVAAPISGQSVRVSFGGYSENLSLDYSSGSLYTRATISFSPFASYYKVLKYELEVPVGYDFGGYCQLKESIPFRSQPISPSQFDTGNPICLNPIFECDYSKTCPKSFIIDGTMDTDYLYAYPLYANLIPQKYVLTFDSLGGSSCSNQEITFDGTYEGKLPTPIRRGYTFSGWYTSQIGGSKITESTVVKTTNDQTLYARWQALTPTITFDPQESSVSPASQTIIYGTSYTLPTPERANYTFDGWYTAATGGNKVDMSGVSDFVENQTLYARWSASKLTVKFDPNNEGKRFQGSMSDQIVDMDNGFALSPNRFAIPGYQFKGWSKDASSDKVSFWDNENLHPNALIDTNGGAVTLYAIWAANTYTVTFYDGSTSIGSKQVTFGSPYGELPGPTREGYRFDGWFTAPSNGDEIDAETEVGIAEDHRLDAHWTAKTYTVTYNCENCSMVTAPESGTFAQQVYIAWKPDEQEGYTFRLDSAKVYAGDSAEGVLLHEWESWTTGYFNMAEEYYESVYIEIVYRKTPNKYVVRFDSDGGESCTNITVTFNAPYGKLPLPERTDHIFLGWYLDETLISETDLVTTASDHTLTARWKPQTYTIEFDPNGGSGAMASITANRGEFVTLPTNELSRVGYRFVKWECGGKRYSDGAQVRNLAEAQKTAALKAIWEPIVYSIKYDDNWSGADGVLSTPLPDSVSDCSYEDEIQIAVDWAPNTQGIAKFLGWSLDAEATMPTYEVGQECWVSRLSTEDGATVTLYAVWEDARNGLTLAVGCDNMILTSAPSGNDSNRGEAWSAGKGCVLSGGFSGTSVSANQGSYLNATVTGAGVLVFKWQKLRFTDDKTAKASFSEGDTVHSVIELGGDERRVIIECTTELAHRFEWCVLKGGDRGVGDPGGTLRVSEVRWYPNMTKEEVEAMYANPEPTESDAPTITRDFSFATDERFDYVIWKKTDLSEPEWSKLKTVIGDGSTVKLPMFVGKQGFFKVEVIQRKAQ